MSKYVTNTQACSGVASLGLLSSCLENGFRFLVF